MAEYFVGPGGNNSNAGTSWALRKLNMAGAESIPPAAGDIVRVAPGTYREGITLGASGGNSYTTGTVSVTNGSTTVTGSGTTFTGNAFADGQFAVWVAASGTDGVTNGTGTFTSAAGNFQSSMIGMTIRINTKGAYTISAVASATSITIVTATGAAASPSAGSGLTYNVGPTDVVEISSVDSNTQLTLKRAWNGPTLTGVAYQTWRDIKYIADVTGVKTDGVGGIVRITGSDNDQTAARSACFTGTRDYRTFVGFFADTTSSVQFSVSGSNNIYDSCAIQSSTGANALINVSGAYANNVFRGCVLWGSKGAGLILGHTSVVDNTAHIVQNCVFMGCAPALLIQRSGGVLCRNNLFIGNTRGIQVQFALTTGQTTTANNNIFNSTSFNGVQAVTAVGTNEEIFENYNDFFGNSTDRSNVSSGPNSVAYPPLFMPPLPAAGYRFPWNPLELFSASLVAARAGMFEPFDGLSGVIRPVTSAKKSWGPIQSVPMLRETATTRGSSAASLRLSDAGRHQVFVPVTNTSTVFSVYVQWEADYAGTKPQMVIKQPGVADTVITATGSSGSWEQLTTTITPAAIPPYVVVELVSNNTAAATNFDVFFDDLTIS